MGVIKEFKEFAMRGNVLDMAVGIIIGGAFGTIVQSMVKDVIMPPIGLALGKVDFSELKLQLQDAVPEVKNAAGEITQKAAEAVTLNYGNFINNVITFLIVAFSVFMLIKAMNSMKKKEEAAPAPPPAPPAEQVLLTEIRDLLAKK
ncbi:MAG: large-conductance mechanosensitive channel protein MscL [Planctomycetes bacterium]|nr:large-conductance mechanosensitive channel protein MscL [Planctomycetota bacterium]MCB9910212.1 large-conductance mechanosensitive channel protein MscL [Planctomycetota bacterium]HPF15278.1 large-conductance mechanosensitive channel protein MscL [Planctomycetota bacterium]HRV79931.1 large-conductance mechanosensitive channel protein MscL [Planctomycetota bacterium]